MRRLILRRLVAGLLVAVAAATLTFALVSAAPGDPMAAVLDHSAIDEATRDQWRAQWALDRPPLVRLTAWLGGFVRFDLGPSIAVGRPIGDAIRDALPYSVLLMGTVIGLSLLLGFVVAIVQAHAAGGARDRWLGRATLVAAAAPEAAIALLLLGVGAVTLRWFPAGGAHGLDAASLPLGWWWRDLVHHLVLPATTLTIGGVAVVARHQRAALAALAPEPFVQLWRARGVAERALWWRLLSRHALAPLVALLGLALPALVGGAVLVERLFAWPGMGSLIATGVARRDAPLVATCVALSAVLVVAGSTITDVLHRWLDPRLRDADG